MKTGFDHPTAMIPTICIGIGGTGFDVVSRLHQQYLTPAWHDPNNTRSASSHARGERLQFLCADVERHRPVSVPDGAPALHMVEPPNNAFESLSAFVRDLPDWIKKQYPFDECAALGLRGGGQPWFDPSRPLSRVCFHWMYPAIKKALGERLAMLPRAENNGGHAKVRIVVICSLYGYTGSAWFADMGLLSRLLVEELPGEPIVDLYAVLPQMAGPQQEANAYAALMELETLLQTPSHYVAHCWPEHDGVLARSYDNVYLFDSNNLVGEKLERLDDLYHLMAESLLQDFQCDAMRERKRWLAFRKIRAKLSGHMTKYGADNRQFSLMYSTEYSALSQFSIDMHLEPHKRALTARWMSKALESFFGIADGDEDGIRPTDRECDTLMEYLFLRPTVFTIEYQYVGKSPRGFQDDAVRMMPVLVDELLRIDGGKLGDELAEKIRSSVQQFESSGSPAEWPDKIHELMQQLERDPFGGAGRASGTYENSIVQRRQQLFAELTGADSPFRMALYGHVDNHAHGGIDSTLALLEAVKNRIAHPETGWLHKLDELGKWFETSSARIESEDIPALLQQLGQARRLTLFGSGWGIRAKVERLSEALVQWIVGRVHAYACKEAAGLLNDLSAWQGFSAELMTGQQHVREAMALLQAEAAAAEGEMTTNRATHAAIPASGVLASFLERDVSCSAAVWTMEAFEGRRGRRELMHCLGTPEGRVELLAELSTAALRTLPECLTAPWENPLFEALRAHPDRAGLFQTCWRRAMPWVNADLDGAFTASREHGICLVGVTGAAQFEREFGHEFRQAIPPTTYFSKDWIVFVEAEVPGKLSCHVDFSGLPLTTLRQLRQWRQSYDEQSDKVAVNIQRRISVFRHPLEPAADELMRLEEDFRIFLEAVACGVLRRRPEEETYEMKKRGNWLGVGNEELVRLRGLHQDNRDTILGQVNDRLDKISCALQLGALCVLFNYYAEHTYPAKRICIDECERLVNGMGHFVCVKLQEQYLRRFQAAAAAEHLDPSETLSLLHSRIDQWSAVIEHSEKDGYRHEVGSEAGPKRAVLPQFFERQWLGHALGLRQAGAQFYVVANNAATGPYDIKTLADMVRTYSLTVQSLVCPVGGAQWVAASAVPQLARLLFPIEPPPLPI